MSLTTHEQALQFLREHCTPIITFKNKVKKFFGMRYEQPRYWKVLKSFKGYKKLALPDPDDLQFANMLFELGKFGSLTDVLYTRIQAEIAYDNENPKVLGVIADLMIPVGTTVHFQKRKNDTFAKLRAERVQLTDMQFQDRKDTPRFALSGLIGVNVVTLWHRGKDTYAPSNGFYFGYQADSSCCGGIHFFLSRDDVCEWVF